MWIIIQGAGPKAPDDILFNSGSCVAMKSGVYYMRDHSNEMRRGWALWKLPRKAYRKK